MATLKGLGAIPTDEPNFLGMLGMHGSRAANLAIDNCDLLICVGARFDDRATGKLDSFATRARVIHIDGDPAEIGKLEPPRSRLLATSSSFSTSWTRPRTSATGRTMPRPEGDVGAAL